MSADRGPHSRWTGYVVAVVLGVALGLLLPGIVYLGAPRGTPTAISPTQVVARAGESWTMTPPSTWCTRSPLSGGGTEFTCHGPTAWVDLPVNASSRLAGRLDLNGPSELWLVPWPEFCTLAAELSGFLHPCPPPYDAPSWSAWHVGFPTGGEVNLSRLNINITKSAGVLPPESWEMWFIDTHPSNETATAVSDLELVPVA